MGSKLSLSYVDKLQRENADDLAFYPFTTLEKALEGGQILHCEENGEPAGYLWFGSIRPGYDVTIYQACIDYDARRRHLGHGMVADLIQMANIAGAVGVRLKCASSAESNQFWQSIGFTCTRVSRGGRKRSRDINHYRVDLQPALFLTEPVKPSTAPIDLRAYNESKRDGEIMASPFSRSHY